MILNQLLEPEILLPLGKAGYGSRVLIADGSYPFRPVDDGRVGQGHFLRRFSTLIFPLDHATTLAVALKRESA